MVRSRWFDRMKFAPIIFLRSFRSHCPTVGPNLTLAIENYLRSSDQSLTWQTTTDYLQLLFSSDTARFFIRFSIRPSDPPISRVMGRRLKGKQTINLKMLLFIILDTGSEDIQKLSNGKAFITSVSPVDKLWNLVTHPIFGICHLANNISI